MSFVIAVMDYIMATVEQLFAKEKQLQNWYCKHPIVLLIVRCAIIVGSLSCVCYCAWYRDIANVAIASVGMIAGIVPMIWEGSDFGDSDSEDDSDGPDDPDSPTGDSADRWLRSKMRVKA